MIFKLATAALLVLTPHNIAAQDSLLEFNLDECVVSFDASTDYFPQKYEKPNILSYGAIDIFGQPFTPHNTTDLLDITYHNTYKIISNHYHNRSYLLYQCGTEPPQDLVDSGDYHLVLPIPHQGGLILTETPQIPPLELLGLREEIIAYAGDTQYVSSPCLNYMMDTTNDENETLVDRVTGTFETQPNITAAYLVDHPDAILFGGIFADADGDRVMGVAASQERTNVATFDWIAMYAALYNKEGMANRIRAETQASYDCSRRNALLVAQQQRRALTVSNVDRQLQEEEQQERPKILWANWFDDYLGSPLGWSVAQCPTWDHTYYCEYAEHCNAEIMSRPDGLGSAPEVLGGAYWYLNDTEFLEFAKDADVWIYGSQFWDSMFEKKGDIVSQIKAFQDKEVYDTQGQGPNAWYEQRLAEYDVVGLDVCEIVDNGASAHVRRWLRNIATEPVGTYGTCNAPEELSEPYIPGGAVCVPLDGSDEIDTPVEITVDSDAGGEAVENPADGIDDSDADSEEGTVEEESSSILTTISTPLITLVGMVGLFLI